jgi:hypothetical protein
MRIDIHTHLFPEAIRNNRNAWFAGEPAFKLLYDSPKSRMSGAEELIQVMDEQGIDRSVVFGFPWISLETARRNNDYIIKSVNRHSDRLIGFCCMDPGQPGAENEVLRCLDQGLKGVGELAFYQAGIDETALAALKPIMDICRNRDVPVMIHTNEPIGHIYPGKAPMTLEQIYRMVRRFPDNDLILAHWGGGILFYALLKKEVRETLKRVWFDTAASPFLYNAAMYREAVAIIGPDKILFGSDYPLLKPARYVAEMENAGIDHTVIEQIMGGNSRKLLGI